MMLLEMIIILLLIGLDQLVKYFTVVLLKGQPPVVLINNVFELMYVENKGAAFGILENKQILFIIITIIVLLIMFIYYIKIPKDKKFNPLKLTIILFVSGAIGNFIDRVRLGYVIDMFYFKLIDFPVFNVADAYISIASVFLIVLVLLVYKNNDLDFFTMKKESDKNE